MTIDPRQFHQVFFEESFEGLEAMEQALLTATPGQVEAETINAIFRVAHTIKGGAATFGFERIAALAHRLETLLDQMRAGKRLLDEPAIELLLGGVDLIRAMIEGARQGIGIDDEAQVGYISRLEQAIKGEAISPTPLPSAVTARPEPAPKAPAPGWRIRFRPDPSILAHGNDVVLMFRELSGLGDFQVKADLSALPSLPELEVERCYLAWQAELRGAVERRAVEEVFEWVADESELEILPIQGRGLPQPAAPVTDEAVPSGAGEAVPAVAVPKAATLQEAVRRVAAEPGGSIRVSIEKVDALVDLVGELVITQSMLSRLKGAVVGELGERLVAGLNQLERHTRNLQDSVLGMRMLPIAFVFNRFPRMVRDLAAGLGKQVVLEVQGESTEIDKTVMEAIGDPLMHLVRNAIDHGLEQPQERRSAGKPAAGRLSLSARHRSGSIYVEVRDDGRGIDPAKILDAARAKGLLSGDAPVDAEAALNLLFHPGFSTAAEVSDISGRGVGLDVVNRNVRALGGSVGISSDLGRGTLFTLRLPLTLAILDGQLVQVGGSNYILPLEAIVETIRLEPARLSSLAHWLELYLLRDDYIPVIHLARLFQCREAACERPLVVIVGYEGHRVGLVVEQLLHQQQVVIKSLESNFWKVEGISAATILGDGTVGLILDISGLIQIAGRVLGETTGWRPHRTASSEARP
ncbi:MAG: chemotaxis protein CheA [Gammaproteobacteria bacterium]|nr:chemotaxis protein CheA [Gammaproteobacteria bacterium]MBU1655313.1 chemotaxis protein CheA [Gammaproteobacteria bacterium]MBU1961458.1 chemotaxis protein CheA [Gammaproteobacteria bacterium]